MVTAENNLDILGELSLNSFGGQPGLAALNVHQVLESPSSFHTMITMNTTATKTKLNQHRESLASADCLD